MEPAEYLVHLRREVDALLDAAAAGLHRPVPSCPEWDVSDLVLHVGNTWARGVDVLASGQNVERRPLPVVGSDADLLAWGRERADEVVSAVEHRSVPDPDGECWTLVPPNRRGFWARRMALETVLHGWDCANAVGRTAPMDADLAGDGVDEFLSVMLPRCLTRNPGTWAGETVHLHRTDGEGEWLVRLESGTATTERGHAKGDVAVRGSGSDLYLWVSGRGTVDTLPALDVIGDREMARRWSAEVVF